MLIQKSSLRGHATLSSPSPSPSPSPPASPSLTPPSATTPPSDYSPPFIELKYTSKSHVHHAPCVECGARATPEWRAGPAGASTYEVSPPPSHIIVFVMRVEYDGKNCGTSKKNYKLRRTGLQKLKERNYIQWQLPYPKLKRTKNS